MNLKNVLFLTAFFCIVLLSSQCVTTSVENPCLAPPPTFSFVLLDKNDKELITKSNKDSVKIFYWDGSLNKRLVFNILVNFDSSNSSNPSFQSFANADAIIPQSANSNDPIFSLELSGFVVGKIQLKTFEHNEKCNRWYDVSEVRFNDKLVDRQKLIFKTD